jgi:hypothetical protein
MYVLRFICDKIVINLTPSLAQNDANLAGYYSK